MSELLAFSTATTTAVLFYGFLLGLRHATEADHLAAVTTIVTARSNLWMSSLVGGLWGIGHTISLLAAGIFVLVLNYQISEHTERMLEFGVGIMLVLLGLNVIRKLLNGGHLHFHTHEHGAHTHTHPHLHDHDYHQHTVIPATRGQSQTDATHHGLRLSPRALLVGMVHGLAGSAALMLLVIPTIKSRIDGMIYITVFGVGSIGGMMIMSFVVGLPFHLTAKKFNRFNVLLQGIAGLVSLVLGLWIVYLKGFSDILL